MYETVLYDLDQIVLMYLVFIGASIVTLPLMTLILNAVSKGVSKWR